MSGTVRTFEVAVQDVVEAGLRRLPPPARRRHGGVDYRRNYPATVNTAEETTFAGRVAAEVAGSSQVIHDPLAWERKISPSCSTRSPGPMCGSVRQAARAAAWSTTPATTSTTIFCRSAPAIGPSWWKQPCRESPDKCPISVLSFGRALSSSPPAAPAMNLLAGEPLSNPEGAEAARTSSASTAISNGRYPGRRSGPHHPHRADRTGMAGYVAVGRHAGSRSPAPGLDGNPGSFSGCARPPAIRSRSRASPSR